MYYLEALTIHKMIVHILDPSLSLPVLSMQEMPPSPDTAEFFANHIIRVLNDDGIKTCHFDEEYNLFLNYLKDYKKDESGFAHFSQQAAEQLFTIMSANPMILPGDLALIAFQYSGAAHIALLKMSYQSTYIHYTDFENDLNVNTIIQHRTTLPNMSQRIGEAVVIKLDTMDVLVLEKPVEIEGTKENYLSKFFLKCGTKLSSKEQYAIVKNVTDQISKKYFDEDIEKKMTIKQELFNQMDEEGEINLTKFAEEVFDTQVELKQTFLEALEKKGLEKPAIQLTEKTIAKTFEKQKIKTDNGIEIKIPMELYNNPNSMEFVTNPDGKISIILKNIGKILG